MNISKNNFSSIEQITGQYLKNNEKQKVVKPANTAQATFSEILQERRQVNENKELKFSKHANERLNSRNIDLSESQLQRLEDGAKRAQEKGINESLVMVDNLAFIVNVKNNTVVTAVNDKEDKVFTNIDGAVIM